MSISQVPGQLVLGLANRVGLDNPGQKSPDSEPGLEADHAQTLCPTRCTYSGTAAQTPGDHPGRLDASIAGFPVSADPPTGRVGRASQSGCRHRV